MLHLPPKERLSCQRSLNKLLTQHMRETKPPVTQGGEIRIDNYSTDFQQQRKLRIHDEWVQTIFYFFHISSFKINYYRVVFTTVCGA